MMLFFCVTVWMDTFNYDELPILHFDHHPTRETIWNELKRESFLSSEEDPDSKDWDWGFNVLKVESLIRSTCREDAAL